MSICPSCEHHCKPPSLQATGRYKFIKSERMRSHHYFSSQNCLKPPFHIACVELEVVIVEVESSSRNRRPRRLYVIVLNSFHLPSFQKTNSPFPPSPKNITKRFFRMSLSDFGIPIARTVLDEVTKAWKTLWTLTALRGRMFDLNLAISPKKNPSSQKSSGSCSGWPSRWSNAAGRHTSQKPLAGLQDARWTPALLPRNTRHSSVCDCGARAGGYRQIPLGTSCTGFLREEQVSEGRVPDL